MNAIKDAATEAAADLLDRALRHERWGCSAMDYADQAAALLRAAGLHTLADRIEDDPLGDDIAGVLSDLQQRAGVMGLVLERRQQANETRVVETARATLMMSPPLGEEYWEYRVRLSARQAIVGFPKFTTIGIGFAVEDDWNTNLPYGQPAEDIFDHIKHNKGDDSISDDDCIAAIRLVQEAATADRGR